MSKTQFLSPKSQAGQAIVLIAFMIIVLFGAIGLAVDGGIAYYYNSAAERAAASAALAGVIFMPAQLTPCCGGNDATDRALVAARRNGFSAASNGVPFGPNNITVTVSTYTDPISGKIQPESLQVTVSRNVSTFFMQLFGITTVNVSRTAVAQYLKPLKLGEPCLYPGEAPGATGDCHTGSTVSQLGNSGFYILRTEGWSIDRTQGDAYTPNNVGCASPACNPAPAAPAVPDVHQISGTRGTDVVDPSLPVAGGYNYILTVPAGYSALIQVYNAVFAPDGNLTGQDFCENWLPALRLPSQCSPGGVGCPTPPGPGGGPPPPTGCAYHMHEDDTKPYGTASKYSAMEYTIFNAPSVFIRSSDTFMSQMLVMPVDASNWKASPPTYDDINNPGKQITQTYDVLGRPTDMTAYHSWMDVGSYTPLTTCTPACLPGFEPESSIIKYTAKGKLAPGGLPGGASGATYRLRIDTLNSDGSIPPGGSLAHKGMAVRVVDAVTGSAPCGAAANPCSLSALDDLSIYTPITTTAGGSFRLPIFSVPAIYAGLTIGVDVYDAGDMGVGNGSIFIGFVDPTTCALFVEPAGGQTATVYDLGNVRTNPAVSLIGSYANPNPVEQIVNDGITQFGNNTWYHFNIPIPGTYSPSVTACDPTGLGYWNLQYRTSNKVTSTDTITVTLNLLGNPAHILKS